MRKYPLNNLEDNLEPWPFEGEASNYQIIRGNPQASGRLDIGSNSGQHRMGIWACTEGAFSCIEVGDELQTIISGRLILTRDDGESISCGPGDSIFTRKGERVTWDIQEDVTKVFFTYNSAGEAGQWDE
jgi:uncharacterized cupin superfamily protein